MKFLLDRKTVRRRAISKRKKKYLFGSKEKRGLFFKKVGIFSVLLTFPFAIFTLFILLLASSGEWSNFFLFKVVLVTPNEIKILVLNPIDKEAVKINIPGDISVEVAGGYGRYLLKNVMKLDRNEKKKGELLINTVLVNFETPLYLWAECQKDPLNSTRQSIEYIFGGCRGNVNFGDRIKMIFFLKSINKRDILDYDLTSSLKSEKNENGKEYDQKYLEYKLPTKVIINFLEPSFSDNFLNVGIYSDDIRDPLMDKIVSLIGNMGGKVVSIQSYNLEEEECRVLGKNKKNASLFAKVFNCELGELNFDSPFDLVFQLNSSFFRRF